MTWVITNLHIRHMHIKKYCRQVKKENANDKGKERKEDDSGDDQAATVSDEFFMIYDNDTVNVACQETSWVIDNSFPIHATSRRNFFTSYTASELGTVKMDNKGVAKVMVVGDVCLETKISTKLVLKNVKHISNILMNLISAARLDDEGYCSTFSDGRLKLAKGAMVVAKDEKCSTLYFLQVRFFKCVLNAVENDSAVELWHKKLERMNEKRIQILTKKNIFSEAKITQLKKYMHGFDSK